LECESFHFLARHTPVCVEIKHHRFSGRGNSVLQLGKRRDPDKRRLFVCSRCTSPQLQSGQWLKQVTTAGKPPNQKSDPQQKGYDAETFPQLAKAARSW